MDMEALAAEARDALARTFVNVPTVVACEPDFIMEDYDGKLPYLSIDGDTFTLVPVERSRLGIGRMVKVTVWVVLVASGGSDSDCPDVEEVDVRGGSFGGAVQLAASLWAQDQMSGHMEAAFQAKWVGDTE